MLLFESKIKNTIYMLFSFVICRYELRLKLYPEKQNKIIVIIVIVIIITSTRRLSFDRLFKSSNLIKTITSYYNNLFVIK